MAQHLAKHLINLSDVGFRPQRRTPHQPMATEVARIFIQAGGYRCTGHGAGRKSTKSKKNIFAKPIDNTSLSVVLCSQMTEVQSLLTTLRAKYWTNAAIADEIGVNVSSVDKWQAGVRNTSQSHLILLKQLLNKKPPKRRRYDPGSRNRGGVR